MKTHGVMYGTACIAMLLTISAIFSKAPDELIAVFFLMTGLMGLYAFAVQTNHNTLRNGILIALLADFAILTGLLAPMVA